MPVHFAALYVFRWSFLVAGVLNLVLSLGNALLVQNGLDRALTFLVNGAVLTTLSFVAQLLLDREE